VEKKKYKYDPAKIKFLTVEEMRRLFAVIKGKRDRALFLIAYRHGLRASEVGTIRLEDIDFQEARIRITRLKGSMPSIHPLQSDELKALKAYVKVAKIARGPLFLSNRRAPISRRTLDYLMKGYGERAGLAPELRHFHCLKHSIATHMLENDFGVLDIKDWLGHRSLRNTVIYTFLTDARREDVALKLAQRMPRF
jgi:site-specific recombinase XerD